MSQVEEMASSPPRMPDDLSASGREYQMRSKRVNIPALPVELPNAVHGERRPSNPLPLQNGAHGGSGEDHDFEAAPDPPVAIADALAEPQAPPIRQQEGGEREPEQQQPETLEEVQQIARTRANEYDNGLLKLFTDLSETTGFYDPALQNDLEGDYLAVAKKFLKRMENIAKEIQKEKKERAFLLSSKAVGGVLEQLDKKKVYICAVGRTNMGKSRTLNLLMNNDALPVNVQVETAAIVHIVFKPETEQPQLVTEEGRRYVGSENISKYLRQQHSDTRRIGKASGVYTLEAPVAKLMNDPQLIKMAHEFSLILVDTPGSNEVGEEALQRLAEDNIISATALLYFMKYDDLANNTDYKPIQEACKYDEALFLQDRLTIVVTHYDKFFEADDDDNAMDVKKVKEIVVSNLKKIGLEASGDVVVPVSSEWAYQARKCLESNGAQQKDKVIINWIRYQQHVNPHRGQSIIAEAVAKSSIDAAREIDAASNFAELEERLLKSADQLQKLWSRNLLVRCRHFASLIVQDLENLQNTLLFSKDKLTSATQAANACRDIISTLRPGNLEGINKFVEDLEAAYMKDIGTFYEEVIHPEYDKDKEEFLMKLEIDPNLFPEEWKSEVEEFRQSAHHSLKQCVRKIHFKECPVLLKRHQLSINRKVARLQGITATITGHKPTTLIHGDNDAERGIEDHTTLEQLRLKVQPENLEHIDPPCDKVSFFVKWTFVLFGLKNVVRKEHIANVTDHMEQALKDSYDNLVNGRPEYYKEKVLAHYLMKYCEESCKTIDKFVNQDTRACQEAIDKMRNEGMLRSKYRCWQDHVGTVRDKLNDLYKRF